MDSLDCDFSGLLAVVGVVDFRLILGLLRERPTRPREKKQSEVYGKFVSGGRGWFD
jgi:hypothetical protein